MLTGERNETPSLQLLQECWYVQLLLCCFQSAVDELKIVSSLEVKVRTGMRHPCIPAE